MKFKASFDWIAKVFSTLFSLIIISIVLYQMYVFYNTRQPDSVIGSFFLLAILFVPFVYHPLNYLITGNQIIIRRPLKNVIIQKHKIGNVKIVDQQNMKGTLRSFGVAGLFGYYGRFSNLKIGSMLWFATQRKNYVLIQTNDDKNYILTPDNPNEFVKQFLK
jgi:hypothetical protein